MDPFGDVGTALVNLCQQEIDTHKVVMKSGSGSGRRMPDLDMEPPAIPGH